MLIGTTQYVNCITLKFFLVVQALEEGIGFVLTACEGKHVVDCDDEERDDEGTPKTYDKSDKASKIRLWVDISVTRGGQGDNNIPHSVGKEVEILPGNFWQRTFEYFQLVAEKENRNC